MGTRNAHDASSEAVVRGAARTNEPDRYLSALLAPRRVRSDLIALAAYLGEIARIPHVVREPVMGEIRLQWWRDTLDTVRTGAATGSPVADALGGAMRRHDLALELLAAPIEARARALDPEQGAAPITGVTDYVGATEGAAFRLSARILGVDETPAVATLLRAAAQAYGRARLARGFERRAPELRQEARRWLSEARQLLPGAPPAVLPAVLPAALVEPYLDALEGAGPEITGEQADISPLTRVGRLWWAKVRRRI